MANIIMDKLPRSYRKSALIWGFAKGIVAEFKNCLSAKTNLDKELCLDTAEKFLSRWESDLKIVTIPYKHIYAMSDYTVKELSKYTVNELAMFYCTKPIDTVTIEDWYELRRGNIRAKLCGFGYCTESMVKNIVESYTNGKVNVDCDYKNYIVNISFISKIGKPKAIKQIEVAINEVIPAHLIVNYKFIRRTWIEVYKNTKKWADLTRYTWQEILEMEDILNEH